MPGPSRVAVPQRPAVSASTRLTDVGNAAFINDVVAPHSKQPRRDVTLVFRTANVLVTVSYAESAPSGSLPLSSADLQKGAQEVADQIERKVKG